MTTSTERNLLGQAFGRLTVVSFAGTDKNGNTQWLCLCQCGAQKTVSRCHLIQGDTKSCGCWQSEVRRARIISLEGKRFGRLVVLSRVERPFGKRGVLWLCQCDCGEQSIVFAENLLKGRTQSCGCFHRVANRTHGMSGTPLYQRWQGMIARCEDVNSPGYADYGGRGIRVDKRWRESFEAFKQEMPFFPGKGWSLERIDVDGDYRLGNCKWTPKDKQAANQRRSIRLLTGETFGAWTILRGPVRKHGVTYYLCQCQCGLQRLKPASVVKSGRSKSCGYLDWSRSPRNFKPGQTVGHWIIIQGPIWGKAGRIRQRFYQCRCGCGRQKLVNAGSLKSGDSKSCGCHGREKLAA
jgi:hypothetical protein